MKEEEKIKEIYNKIKERFELFAKEYETSRLNLMQLFVAFETANTKAIYEEYGRHGYGVLEHMKNQIRNAKNK